MTSSSGPLGRVAVGLGLVVAALNLLWLATTLHVLSFVLREDFAWPGVAETLLVLSVLPSLLFLAGECCCLAAPGRRGVLVGAVALTVLALALATWIDAPSWLRVPAALLGGGAHAAFLYFLHQLARSIDSERLAARALGLCKATLALLAVAAAVVFGANDMGLMIGTVGVLLAGLVWLCLYCFLLLHLREAVLRAAGRAEGGRVPR